jgi:hypothetical protein
MNRFDQLFKAEIEVITSYIFTVYAKPMEASGYEIFV